MPFSPLISCLCVTKNKLEILKRAINCYQAQTYPNKELVLVRDARDSGLVSYLKKLNDPSISLTPAPPNHSLELGDLRNLAVKLSKGKYVCVWDDDDWNHSERLALQMSATLLSKHPASALTNLLVYDETKRQGYFSRSRLWEGTLLCKKDLFSKHLRYPSLTHGEDTSLLKVLLTKSRVFPVTASTAYIYIFHGRNTWNAEHFRKFVFHQPLSKNISALIGSLLRSKKDVGTVSHALDRSSLKKELNYFYEPVR